MNLPVGKKNKVVMDNNDPEHRSRIILNVPKHPFNRYWGHKDDKRPWLPLESAVSFRFLSLVRKLKIYFKNKYPGITSPEITEMISKSLLKFTINNQYFDYTYSTHERGDRWFILCPKCHTKAIYLFLPDNSDRENLYLCRWCHKLRPLSIIFSRNIHYKGLVKPLKELESIKAKLLRKNVTSKEAEPLLRRYEELQEYISKSSEYKLWKFKREHGKYL